MFRRSGQPPMRRRPKDAAKQYVTYRSQPRDSADNFYRVGEDFAGLGRINIMDRMAAGTNGSETMRGNEREPALDDMLTDPMTQALMASDGVDAEKVKDLLAAARRRYASSALRPRRR
jgi:hypothetical protein